MSFGDTTRTGMTSRTSTEDLARSVSAFFDTRDHAENARRDLIQAGIPDNDITLTDGTGGKNAATPIGAGSPAYREQGFWESLKELFMPEEDRHSYAEGISRGGYLVSVFTDTASYDRVVDILDRDGAVDMDERESSWRNEGWTGYTGRDTLADADASYTPPSAGTAGFGASDADRLPVGGTPSGAGSFETATGSVVDNTRIAGAGQEETIPVVEEDVRIVKRDVSHGRARVRSYVVETPESEP